MDSGQGPTFRVVIGQSRQQVLANVIQSTSGTGAQAVQTAVVATRPQTSLQGQSITSTVSPANLPHYSEWQMILAIARPVERNAGIRSVSLVILYGSLGPAPSVACGRGQSSYVWIHVLLLYN